MPKNIDLTGQRFGKLVVLGLDGKIRNDKACLVRCDCGVEKRIPQTKLTTKHKPNRSCGCGVLENHPSKHNMTKHRFYPIWRSMRGRCYNKGNNSYCNYGERGIDICEEWRDSPVKFVEWLEQHGYKKGLEIDRIDNNSGYSPSNCRIVEPKINCRNRRNSVKYDYKGRKITLSELEEISGVKYQTLRARIKIQGLTAEQASKPNGKEGPR